MGNKVSPGTQSTQDGRDCLKSGSSAHPAGSAASSWPCQILGTLESQHRYSPRRSLQPDAMVTWQMTWSGEHGRTARRDYHINELKGALLKQIGDLKAAGPK